DDRRAGRGSDRLREPRRLPRRGPAEPPPPRAHPGRGRQGQGPMKPTSVYRCQACGFQTGKWYGRCPDCSAFNTMVEERTAPSREGGLGRRRVAGVAPVPAAPRPLAAVPAGGRERITTGIAGLDRAPGGGRVGAPLVT